MILEPTSYEIDKFSEEQFEERLNEIYGDIIICGESFQSGTALKELDPTAFDVMLADAQESETVYECPVCGRDNSDEDGAKWCCQEQPECDICGITYDTCAEAEDCCQEEDDD